MDAIAEIKQLYYAATKATIQKDLARAIDLLKTLPNDEERERVAVYMDGLSQMRSEWAASTRGNSVKPRRDHGATRGGGKPTSEPPRPASARPNGPAPGRSGRR